MAAPAVRGSTAAVSGGSTSSPVMETATPIASGGAPWVQFRDVRRAKRVALEAAGLEMGAPTLGTPVVTHVHSRSFRLLLLEHPR